jgi:hypothetical protein
MSNHNLFETVRAWIAVNYPGLAPEVVRIGLRGEHGEITLPVPAVSKVDERGKLSPFVPNAVQEAILEHLEGRAMRTDALASAIKIDRRDLFRKPGGIEELRELGMLALHPRLGHYRPDFPPPELSETQGD